MWFVKQINSRRLLFAKNILSFKSKVVTVVIWRWFLSFCVKVLPTRKCVQKMIVVLSSLLCKRIDILLVRKWVKVTAASFLSRSRASRCGIVDIHVFRFVGGTVGSLSLVCFSHVLIECPLAVGDAV